MIVDAMTKHEVMETLRHDWKEEIEPYVTRKNMKVQLLCKDRCCREKRMIVLNWETKETSSKIVFHILYRAHWSGPMPMFLAEFEWNGRRCYASILGENAIAVYTRHVIERYMERVLHKETNWKDVLVNHVIKHEDNSFHIVLESPKHQNCIYDVYADALFLGDYDTEADNNVNNIWHNTCISIDECHNTQSKILKSFAFMQDTVKKLNYNPVKEAKEYKREKKRNFKNISKETITEYFKIVYMFYKLHLSFNFEYTNKFTDEINKYMNFIKNELADFGIDADKLNPYDKLYGIAAEGEIDYKVD